MRMKAFTDLFIRRPVPEIVVSTVIVVAGLQYWRSVSVRQYPRSEQATASISGVQRADVVGGRIFAMRVWMRPEKMAAMNISPSQVRAALSANNYLSAIGSTKGEFVQVNLTANTDLHTVDDFRKMIVRQQN